MEDISSCQWHHNYIIPLADHSHLSSVSCLKTSPTICPTPLCRDFRSSSDLSNSFASSRSSSRTVWGCERRGEGWDEEEGTYMWGYGDMCGGRGKRVCICTGCELVTDCNWGDQHYMVNWSNKFIIVGIGNGWAGIQQVWFIVSHFRDQCMKHHWCRPPYQPTTPLNQTNVRNIWTPGAMNNLYITIYYSSRHLTWCTHFSWAWRLAPCVQWVACGTPPETFAAAHPHRSLLPFFHVVNVWRHSRKKIFGQS